MRFALQDTTVHDVDCRDVTVHRAHDAERRGRDRPPRVPEDQPQEREQEDGQRDVQETEVAEYQQHARQGGQDERYPFAGDEWISFPAHESPRDFQNAARSSSFAE